MTIEHITLNLNLSSGNAAIVEGNVLENLAATLERELVARLRLGADYGNIRDDNGNTVGSWNVWIDGDEE